MTIHHYTPEPDRTVFFDFETQSAADLRAVGGRKYADDASTRVLSLVCVRGREVVVWIPAHMGLPVGVLLAAPEFIPDEHKGAVESLYVVVSERLPFPLQCWIDAGHTFVGHNVAGFDVHIWRECVTGRGLGPMPAAWADTLYLARAAGLPGGGLDRLAKKILGTGKDAAKSIVRKLWDVEMVNGVPDYPPLLPGMVAPLVRYNLGDVLLLPRLWELFDDLPVEVDVIQAHQNINDRGIAVDVGLIHKIEKAAAVSVERAADEISRLTGGELHAGNIRSGKQVHEWLARQGVRVVDYTGKASLRKDVVAQAIANPVLMLDEDLPITAIDDIDPVVFDVLNLRAAALRITEAKMHRAASRVGEDGRIRDLFSYHQAHTGRWSSVGVQVHNLPRPKRGVELGKLFELHESGAWAGTDESGPADYDRIAATLPADSKLTVDDCLSALIRPCLIAPPGRALLVVDFASVEARCVAWMAGEETLLEAFRTGADVYCLMASKIYGREITPNDNDERQVGKTTVLGCGFSMGPEKFAIASALMGVNLAKAGTSATACVEAYRAAYPKIAGTYSGQFEGRTYRRGGLWDQFEQAAKLAISDGGVRAAGKCTFVYVPGGGGRAGELRATLPSGRQMRYNNARIEDVVPAYARAMGLTKTKPTIIYENQHGATASLYGGKITENLSQAICRDLMATGMVALESPGPVLRAADYMTIGTVHDEILGECDGPFTAGALEDMMRIMSTPPEWAAEFPLAVEGHAAPRYLKSSPKGWPKGEAAMGRVQLAAPLR